MSPSRPLVDRLASLDPQAFRHTFLRNVRRYYPFTIAGTILFAGSLYLLGRSFALGNPYAFLLSAAALILEIVLISTGTLLARRAKSATFTWDSSEPLYAQTASQGHRLSIRNLRLLPFYRLHLLLRGPIHVGRSATLNVVREVSSHGEAEVKIPLLLPLSGIFHARLVLKIKDMFGLTSSHVNIENDRAITIRPPLLSKKDSPRIQAQSGQENQSRMKSADVERYFMREYIPGDRERDINWKASSRFQEIFTRISPVTQERTQLITVHFRPFSPYADDSLRAIAFLDRCKSWMLFFLRSVKTQHPEYEFRVIIGGDVVEIEEDGDIEQFVDDVSGMHLRSDSGGMFHDAGELGGGATFIFTTAYDSSLGEVLSSLPGETVHIFRVVLPEAKESENGDLPVRFRLFDDGNSPLLAGSWILRRDKKMRNIALHGGGDIKVEDDPLEVHLV